MKQDNASPRWRRWLRRSGFVAAAALLCGAVWASLKYRAYMTVPTERLALDGHYAELPPGQEAHYINHPIDHADPDAGEYRGFYLLSPGFSADEPVVFFLTDGQMELVGPQADFAWFDRFLGGTSYVLIGRRGHSPTLFPEVYDGNGLVDHGEAIRLYGSWQHVEDIERVRLDMESKGLLPTDRKISLFGASGAGFLVQQYLSRYGAHVSRALIENSGAPDLAKSAGQHFIRDFGEFNPQAAAALAPILADEEIDKSAASYLLFQVARGGMDPRRRQTEIVAEIRAGARAFEYGWVSPEKNYRLAAFLLRAPAAEASKVRMFELMGQDLRAYDPVASDLNLVYAWTAEILADYLRATDSEENGLARSELDRKSFGGQVLVVAAANDVVFSVEIARAISAAYPSSRLIVLDAAHRTAPEDEDHRRDLRLAFFRNGLRSNALEEALP